MKVKININSKVDGTAYSQDAVGELKITDGGFSLNYRLEGDDCLLKAEGRLVSQKRSGELNINLNFLQGESTDCALNENGCRFPFKLYTHICAYKITQNGLEVSLVYDAMDAKTQLFLTAQKI